MEVQVDLQVFGVMSSRTGPMQHYLTFLLPVDRLLPVLGSLVQLLFGFIGNTQNNFSFLENGQGIIYLKLIPSGRCISHPRRQSIGSKYKK